jgi:putative transcriptional regulator
MIRHHPLPEVLADYARGALDASAMLVVACHIDVCTVCRSETALWEAIAGELLDRYNPGPSMPGALENACARLDAGGPIGAAQFAALPKYLQRYALPEPLKSQRPGLRRWAAPGVWFAPLRLDAGSSGRSYLVYARAGLVMPQHTHAGREFTLVLHGSFHDDIGTFAQGDFIETDESVVHAPAVADDGACLCLVSSETPMQLESRPARLVQWLFGSLY